MDHLAKVTHAARQAIGARYETHAAVFTAIFPEIHAAKLSGYRHRQINDALKEAGLNISTDYYRHLYSDKQPGRKSTGASQKTPLASAVEAAEPTPIQEQSDPLESQMTTHQILAKVREVGRRDYRKGKS